MEDVLFYQQTPGSFSGDTVFSSCWLSIVHALLMQFVWRAGYVESVVAFAIMRPIHSSYLLGFVMSTLLLDPNDYGLVVLSPPDLDKALVAFFSYVGTLAAHCVLKFFVLHVLSFLWRHIIAELTGFVALMIASALFEEATEMVTGIMASLLSILLRRLIAFIASGWTPLVANRVLNLATDSLSRLRHSLATSGLVERLFGRIPYSRLPSFRYSTINPANQVRLLKIHRRNPLMVPTATLIIYDIVDLPPFEAVSFAQINTPEATSPMILILNDQRYTATKTEYNMIRRLSCLFQPRLVWISAICVDENDRAEAAYESIQKTIMLDTAFRVLVCLGESHAAALAVGFGHILTMLSWKFGLDTAISHLERICCGEGNLFDMEMMDCFLEFLDHPWFEDRQNFAGLMGRGRQVTFVYGNQLLMAQYVSHVGQILARTDLFVFRIALGRTGQQFRWPLAALGPLVDLARSVQRPEQPEPEDLAQIARGYMLPMPGE
ncbi:hypothetical protein DL771_008564 [Monosporascus sp. 5C6A]|nr:hypothetical protein DL771_008564 [Monosporascus sp. 5C6A]